MISLNTINGASTIINFYASKIVGKFHGDDVNNFPDLIGVEMGIGYGGEVEQIASMWKGRGKVYGFDTFEDLHPRQLSDDKFSFEATCMDHWYNPAVFGTKALSYDFMRKTLDTEGLTNAILIKGLVNKDSCKDIPYIHFAILDMDMIASMKVGWEAIKDKLVKGAYVFIHDALPPTHLPKLHEWWYKEVLPNDKSLKLIEEWPNQYLVGVEKL